ncbi:MAG: response regulator [Nitrospirota bacterium]|jgi:CheY-like chemotaxis protein|nr:response regulator [Nitrospirota bacterium]MDH4360653.1 response regulator [Nitrospirota bacterium]MDH5297037.1 response regulator [Nitrospirota bacterium]MDH5574709.1 response regulator [Nitrospirota bacterium]
MNPDTMVLIAEDDDGHAALIEKNLRRGGMERPSHRLRDGRETVDFFFGSEQHQPAKGWHRYLLLLDINLPRINGIEVLRRIKEHEALKRVPVLMLSTTDDPKEVETCHAIGCNFYLIKPTDPDAFAQVIARLGSLLDLVIVPGIRLGSPSGISLN